MKKETVFYGPDHEFQVFDCLVPDRISGPLPVVICIHGGGWHAGTRVDMEPYGRLLVGAGFAAILTDYRLSGAHSHPAQIEDMETVLAWIGREGVARGLDRTRVSVTGASAGGHLAALLGLRATRHPNAPCKVRCMIPVCGVHDFTRFLVDNPGMVHCVQPLLGGLPEECPDRAKDASPFFQVHPKAPPCLCMHGTADDVVPLNQSEILVAAIRRVGVEADLVKVEGCGHTANHPNTQPLEPLGSWPVFWAFLQKHNR